MRKQLQQQNKIKIRDRDDDFTFYFLQQENVAANEYNTRIFSLKMQWEGLRSLWANIERGNTPGWEPGKALQFRDSLEIVAALIDEDVAILRQATVIQETLQFLRSALQATPV